VPPSGRCSRDEVDAYPRPQPNPVLGGEVPEGGVELVGQEAGGRGHEGSDPDAGEPEAECSPNAGGSERLLVVMCETGNLDVVHHGVVPDAKE